MMKRILEFFEPKKVFKITNIGWYFIILSCIILTKLGVEKIIGTKETVETFLILGKPNLRIIIGVIELSSGLLLLIPQTSLFGLISITLLHLVYIITFVMFSSFVGIYSPILIVVISSIGFYLRRNGLFNL